MGRFEPDKGLGGAVVADTDPDPDPEPEPGRIWFNTSAENGVEMFVADTDEWVMVGVIPLDRTGTGVANAVRGPADQASDVAKKRVRLARLEKFNSLKGVSQEAFVDDTDPASNPELGAIWFDTSPSEGVDVHVADETGWTAVGRLLYLSAIAPSVSLSVDGDDVATEGDEVEFAVRSSNVDSWEIDYTGDGSIDASGSESPPATLSEEYSSPGTYTATFTARNDAGMKVTAETEITVVEPADFEIVGINGPETIQEGATAEFTATIENPGLAPNEEEVELEIEEFVDQSSSWWYSNYHAVNDRIEDSKQVHLAGEETKEITLEWDDPNRLSSGDTHRASVRTESDEMMITGIDIDDPVFEVLDVDYPQRVDIGESAEISATVSNGSSSSPAQGIVELEIGGSTQSKSVRIGGMERTEVVFEWGGKNDPGVYDLAVNVPRSYLGYTGSTIIVGNSGRFEIEDIGGPYVVEAGDDVTVTATVRNIGSVETTQDIRLEVDGSLEDSERVRLDGGSEDATTLTWSTSSGDSGSAVTEYDLTVSSDDDSDSATVYVREPASFEIEDISAPDQVEADDDVTVTATVRNTGQVAGEVELGFEADGDSIGSDTVTIDGGDTEAASVSVDTSGYSGSVTLTAQADGNSKSTTINIIQPEPANFQVTSIDPPDTITSTDGSVDISATIENTGDIQDTQTVTLSTGEPHQWSLQEQSSDTIQLSSGDSGRVTLPWDSLSPRNMLLKVETEDDEETISVTVEDGITARLTANTTEIDAGESVTFDASSSEGYDYIDKWDFGDGTTIDNDWNTSEEETHTYDDPGEYTATVHVSKFGGGSDTESIDVSVNQAVEIIPTINKVDQMPTINYRTSGLTMAAITFRNTTNSSVTLDGTIRIAPGDDAGHLARSFEYSLPNIEIEFGHSVRVLFNFADAVPPADEMELTVNSNPVTYVAEVGNDTGRHESVHTGNAHRHDGHLYKIDETWFDP